MPRRTPSSTRSSSRGAVAPAPLQGGRLVEAVLGGWRALARVDVDGFALLRSRGITRRANSAVALDASADPDALSAAIDRIEQLYGLTGQPSIVRIFEGHGPAGLEDLLIGRGYTPGPACDLLELPVPAAGRAAAPHTEASIGIGPLPEEWFAASWRLSPRDGAEARETLHDILAGTPAIHVSLPAPGADPQSPPAAVGRGALVDVGRERVAILNCIATDPEHRRQGLGRAVVETLLAAAGEAGARRALLEVETDNLAAVRLYRRLGAVRTSGYRYRVAPQV